MYSIVMVAAMTAAPETPDFFCKKGGCYGGGACYGYSCGGCYGGYSCGGCCGGLGYGGGCGGCWGCDGYATTSSCMGCCGGCYGGYAFSGCCGGGYAVPGGP